MNVNKENHFEKTGVITKKRLTRFNMPHGLHTTFNSGELVPIYYQEVLPNDVKKLKWSSVTRLLTPKYPTMDNAKLDTFFFFIPNRLVWKHWKEFLGENNSDTTPWIQPVEYTVPQVLIPLDDNLRKVGDLADHLEIPIRTVTDSGLNWVKVSALPFRAVAKVWNDWFRDENYELPAHMYDDETVPTWSQPVSSATDYIKCIECGSLCPPVNRYKDYFSSVLPAPQKGAAVRIPLGDYAPIVQGSSNPVPLKLKAYTQGPVQNSRMFLVGTNPEFNVAAGANDTSNVTIGGQQLLLDMQTDLSSATAASVNALRLAFQTQKFLEESARGGTRYTELLFSMFGVNAPDASLQRSEFLGGKSFPISIQPITNVGSDNQLGSVGGMSNTVSGDYAFKRHFTEHGCILGFACVRTDRSYSQGIPRHFFRKDKLDFYFPVFANIGEQPVYRKELFVTGGLTGEIADDNTVIGYQEAWAEYRYALNACSGYMRSGIAGSLNAWTYTDQYEMPPVIGPAWLFSQKEIVDRTIVNQNQHQFIADFYFDDLSYRVLPAYSIPGLIDHH